MSAALPNTAASINRNQRTNVVIAAFLQQPIRSFFRAGCTPAALFDGRVEETVFGGQNVGVTQVGERIWLVTFMRYDLGYFDDETCTVTYPLGIKC